MGFASYDIARTGMYVSQRGLNVTGHNIANISSPGYTKQQMIANDLKYVPIPGIGSCGLGVDVDQLRQLRDTFLDANYRKENSALNYWEVKRKNLEEIQTILDEPFGNGLQETVSAFWTGWQDLVKEPDNLTVRALLRQKANVMVNAFNHIGNQLSKLQSDINIEISSRVEQINNLSKEIADLNLQIRSNEVSGDSANDLRDKRNLALDKLSKIVNIDVQENQDNLLNVTVGGVMLVAGTSVQKLITKENFSGSAYISPAWQVSGDIVEIKSGELKGLLEIRGENAKGEIGSPSDGSPDGVIDISETQTIPSLKEKLNEFFNKMALEVNAIHSKGYGIGNPPLTGIDFFTAMDSTKPLEMGNIQVNPVLLDLNLIAAAKTTAKGDTSNAEEIVTLKNKKLLGSSTDLLDFDEFYRDAISKLGIIAQEAVRMSENQGKLVSEIQIKKETVSGVNMDEEMANMLKYQHAYQASARVMNTIDGMVDNIINQMGR